MSTTQDIRLARLVKKILDFVYGLLIFVLAGLVIWIAITPLLSNQSGFVGTASVPVRIGGGNEPQFDVSLAGRSEAIIYDAYVDQAEGTLWLETNNVLLLLLANGAKLIAGIGIAYVVYLLRRIVQAIVTGDPFNAQTTAIVRRLGYAILMVGILRPVAEYLAANVVLDQLPTAVPFLEPGPTFQAEVLLMTLLILLLAHIWSYGLEIERERALTI